MIPLQTRAFLACRMLSHRSLAMHPPSTPLLALYTRRCMLPALLNAVIVDVDACAKLPSSIVMSHRHQAISCL